MMAEALRTEGAAKSHIDLATKPDSSKLHSVCAIERAGIGG